MLALTRIFQWLSVNRPDISDSVYGYARNGFGDYMGFNAAWGYWISVWVGNVGYLVVMFSAAGVVSGSTGFFGSGSTLPALLCGLTVLTVMHGFVLRGVQSAAFLNIVVTIAKIVPARAVHPLRAAGLQGREFPDGFSGAVRKQAAWAIGEKHHAVYRVGVPWHRVCNCVRQSCT